MKYNITNVFQDLNINENVLKTEDKKNLLEEGYCLINYSLSDWSKRGIDINLVSDVVDDLIEKENWMGGWDHEKEKMKNGKHPEEGAQRLNNLLSKHDCFKKFITLEEVLTASKILIKSEICLSQIIMRMPLSGKGEQPWHVDWIPRKKESDPVRSVLSSVLLDDYTMDNGTTRIVPGSHKFLKEPKDDGYYFQDHPNQKYIIAPKGSLFIYDVNLWHAGTKNISGKKRRHININYRDRIIWQQINFKKELSNIFKNKLSNAEKYLLKVHDEDPLRNDFLFKRRNNFFIKKFMKLYWDLRSENF